MAGRHVSWTSKPTLRDHALSVWQSGAGGAVERLVATDKDASEVVAPVERPPNARSNEWPPPARETDPILVEAVRQTGDEWRLVVDGQLCPERFHTRGVVQGTRWRQIARPDNNTNTLLTNAALEQELQQGRTQFSEAELNSFVIGQIQGNEYVAVNGLYYGLDKPECGLPPPLPPSRPSLPGSTARKVVFTCRLEDEALAPAKVELVMRQVAYSTERRDSSVENREEGVDLDRYELEPYRTNDPTARGYVLPYPFACAPQSSYGILDYAETERWLELAEHHEDRVNRGMTAAAYHESAPKLNEARTYKIGGEKISASKATTELILHIIQAYEALRAWETTVGAFDWSRWRPDSTMEMRVEAVRYFLKEHGDTKALVLWDALAFGPEMVNLDPTGTLEQAVSTENAADEVPISTEPEGNGVIIDINVRGDDDDVEDTSAAETGAFLEYDDRVQRSGLLEGFKKRILRWKNLDFEFVFDRMQFETRAATNIRIEYRIEITEVDGTVRALTIRPYTWFAYVAHSVYTRVDREEQDLRIAVGQLFAVLGAVQAKRRLVRVMRDLVHDAKLFPYVTYESWNKRLQQRAWYQKKPKYRNSGGVLKRMRRNMLQLVLFAGFQTGPQWPEPPFMSDADDAGVAIQLAWTHVRVLPQIVVPRRDVRLPALKVPDNVAVPSDYTDPVRGKERWSTWWAALAIAMVAGVSVALPATLWAYGTQVLAGGWTMAQTMYHAMSAGGSLGGAVVGAAGEAAGAAAGAASGLGLGTLVTALLGAVVAPFAALPFAGPGIASLFIGVGSYLGERIGKTVGAGTAFVETGIMLAPFSEQYLKYNNVYAAWRAVFVGFATFVPQVLSTRVAIISWARRWVRRDEARQRAYDRAQRELRGVPVMSALANARNAIEALRELGMDLYELVHESSRFRLTQAYDRRIGVGGNIPDSAPLYTDNEWDATPSSSLLTLIPPSDITELLYRATVQRRIELAMPVQDVTGSPPASVATTPAEMSAHAAHAELLSYAETDRLPFRGASLLDSAASHSVVVGDRAATLIVAAYGEKAGTTYVSHNDDYWSCMPCGPAARLALRHVGAFERFSAFVPYFERQVERARVVLHGTLDYAAVVAAEANVQSADVAYQAARDAWNTAVQREGNRLGIPALLAGQNFTNKALTDLLAQRDQTTNTEANAIQLQSDALRTALEVLFDADQTMKRTGEYAILMDTLVDLDKKIKNVWLGPRRAQIDSFVKAWRTEGARVARADAKTKAVVTPPEELMRLVAQSTWRMSSFEEAGAVSPLGAIMAVSASPRIVKLFDPVFDAASRNKVRIALGHASNEASMRPGQDALSEPTAVASTQTLKAAWAARRIDTKVISSQHISHTGDVSALIDRLAGLDVGQAAAPAHYLCPTGVTLVGLPGSTPFNTQGDSVRMIWMNMLVNALLVVRNGITMQNTTVSTNTVRIEENDDLEGLSHHPLVITADDRRIAVFLSAGVVDRPNPPATSPPELLGAVLHMYGANDGDTGRWLRDSAIAARLIAFNADRYKHAIALATLQNDSAAVSINVGPGASSTILEVGLALAMYTAETGRLPPSILITCSFRVDPRDMVRIADAVSAACKRAIDSGVKAAHYSEVCVSLSRYR